MKKHYITLLLLCACQSSTPEHNETSTAQIHISAQIESTTPTKSNYGSAQNINRCLMEVYRSSTGELLERLHSNILNKSAEFDISLNSDESYDFILWADCSSSTDTQTPFSSDYHYFTTTLKEVNLDYYNYSGNDDTRDAFCTSFNKSFSTNEDYTIELTRPFGQLNIYTHLSDVIASLCPKFIEISYTKNLPSTFNALSSTATGLQKVSWNKVAPVIDSHKSLPDSTWVHLATDYILVTKSEGATLIDFVVNFYDADSVFITSNNSFINIPIQANHTTDITGELLTQQCSIGISIDPSFESDTTISN
ncbi:MAG: DUF6562 domain-containing protein [Rikenellaceae bacterium]